MRESFATAVKETSSVGIGRFDPCGKIQNMGLATKSVLTKSAISVVFLFATNTKVKSSCSYILGQLFEVKRVCRLAFTAQAK